MIFRSLFWGQSLTCVDIPARSPCPTEQTSHHWLGENGPGWVTPDELLIYAVFDTDEPQGNRLRLTDFDSGQIKRGELSLARHGLTDWPTFRDRVLIPKG